MRKKIAVLALLILTGLVLLTGCGSSDIELKMGETTTIEDYIAFTPTNVLVRADELYAPVGREDGWVYDGDLEDQTYVVMTAKVKNLTNSNIKVANLVHAVLTQGDQKYTTGECMLLTGDGTRLERSGEIEANDEAIVYIMVDAQTGTCGDAVMSLTFTSSLYDGEETYSLACDTTKTVAAAVPLEKGKAATADNYGMLTLDNAKIVKRVNPSKAAKTDGYTYYTPKTKKDLLVDVKLTVKNLQQVTSPSSSFTGAVAVCDGIVHDGFVVAETAGGKDLKSSVKVNPGKEATVRALINVPKEWKGKDISIYLYFDGQEYQYILSGSSK